MNICRSQFRRVIELDRQIRAGRYPNCSGFAREWEVSRKTIQRDIEFLKEHRAPLDYDPARQGYHYTDRSWMLPMMDLTEMELLQLLLAERMAKQFQGTPIAEVLDSLFDKLNFALNEKVTVDPVVFREQFSFHGLPARPIDENFWTDIFKALRGDRVIILKYKTPEQPKPSVRTLEPLHLACIGEEWYLVGIDRDSGEIRNFAVSRIQSVEVKDETFDPEPFDPEEYFANRFGRFVGKPGEEYQFRIRFSKDAAPWILERNWHPRQKIQKHRDGGLTLSFPAPSLYEGKRLVLQWGEDAEVLGPVHLRGELKKSMKKLISRYQQ
ncbi:MAG: WYL domain-containing transcriptional regulator [Planctomycetes bacterium]|nr:WYL domain-containing transcriptional regulator [Planctomycetota bacterium]